MRPGAHPVSPRVPVVEDELKIAKAVREGLEADQYEVVVAVTGEDGY